MEEGDDLCLDGDVECGDVFVGNDDVWIDGECVGNVGVLVLVVVYCVWFVLCKVLVKFYKVKKFVDLFWYFFCWDFFLDFENFG